MFAGLNPRERNILVPLVLVVFAAAAMTAWKYRPREEPLGTTPVAFTPATIRTPPKATVAPPTTVAPGIAPAPAPAPEAPTSGLAPGALIDINTASAKDLELLPQIGPAKAAAIVDDRTRNGPFKSIEDLDRVSGIGEKTLDRLKPYLTISHAPVAPGQPPSAANQTGPGASPAATPPTPALVYINRANVQELQQLNGVGEKMANRIIQDRMLKGPFRKPSDLMRVNGIGPKFLEKNAGRMAFD